MDKQPAEEDAVKQATLEAAMQPQSDEVQAEALEVSSEPEPEAPQVKEKNEERATAANVKEPQLTDTNKKKEEEKEDKRKEKKKEKRAGYLSLFRYATPLDRLILLFSTLCAIAAGAALPLVTIFIGGAISDVRKFSAGETTPDQFRHDVASYPVYFLYLGAGQLVAVYFAILGFLSVGDHVAQTTRQKYLRALLEHGVAGLDGMGAGRAMSIMTEGIHQMQTSISDKAVLLVMALSTVVTAFVVSIIAYWRLALIAMSPLIAVMMVLAFCGRAIAVNTTNAGHANAQAANVSEEALSSINVVKALGAYQLLAAKFQSHVRKGVQFGFKARILTGLLIGGFVAIVMLNVGLDLWMGSRYIVDLSTDSSSVSTIILSMMIGLFTLVTLSPIAATMASGITASTDVFSTIDKGGEHFNASAFSEDGLKLEPEELTGGIEFRDVTFAYHTRPGANALQNLSFSIPANKTTAIVGSSGSGKSSIINLLERFYEPSSGEILFGGRSISTINPRWLRQQMALVDQEPALLTATVRDNISRGLIGTSAESLSEEGKAKLVIQAAKDAGAYDFISSLPDGFNTVLREGGKSLSGGQRQRIAISRALIRKPTLLLLDEPTSALDTVTEKQVQDTLALAVENRTVIVIAHRLATVRNADKIIVMGDGVVVEGGTHEQLMENRATYFSLVNLQSLRGSPDPIIETEETDTTTSQYCDDHGTIVKTETVAAAEPSEASTDLNLSSPALESHSITAEDSDGKTSVWSLFSFTLKSSSKRWHLILLGLVAAIITGAGTPVHVIFLANGIQTLSLPPPQFQTLRDDANFWSAMYFILFGVLLLSNALQAYAFGRLSRALTYELKERLFNLLMRQDNTFFDGQSSIGSLVTLLNNDPAALGFVCSQVIGTFVSVLTTNLLAIGIAIGYGWKLGLVATSTIPILLFCGYLRIFLLLLVQQRARATHDESAAEVREAIGTIRTIVALTSESHMLDSYHSLLARQRSSNIRFILWVSALYTPSVSLFFAVMAFILWYGTRLLANMEYTALQLWVCFVEVMFATQSAAAAFAQASEIAKAQAGAYRIQSVLDRANTDGDAAGKSKKLPSGEGSLELSNISFAYPSRPSHVVLHDISLSIKPGQYVAFVGPSGCGKTSLLSLIERFYSPTSGEVRLDGADIASSDLEAYRRDIGFVSQEINLFEGTVRENICLGLDPTDPPAEQRIIDACKEANIYDLISSLPEGLETSIGKYGSSLSGGQRQRISLARALIRRPRVLLLDEATSKLDSESEAHVHAALESARKGRTTITVAHRLSSIVHADCIPIVPIIMSPHLKPAGIGTAAPLASHIGGSYPQ
ncbi:multidrug resistance protein MDR [Sarocladium strictum]